MLPCSAIMWLAATVASTAFQPSVAVREHRTVMRWPLMRVPARPTACMQVGPHVMSAVIAAAQVRETRA